MIVPLSNRQHLRDIVRVCNALCMYSPVANGYFFKNEFFLTCTAGNTRGSVYIGSVLDPVRTGCYWFEVSVYKLIEVLRICIRNQATNTNIYADLEAGAPVSVNVLPQDDSSWPKNMVIGKNLGLTEDIPAGVMTIVGTNTLHGTQLAIDPGEWNRMLTEHIITGGSESSPFHLDVSTTNGVHTVRFYTNDMTTGSSTTTRITALASSGLVSGIVHPCSVVYSTVDMKRVQILMSTNASFEVYIDKCGVLQTLIRNRNYRVTTTTVPTTM